MTIAIMQPYLFPYAGYWQLINAVDTFVIFDDVNFIKKGYINKNSILINGKSQPFTLELLKASQNKLVNEIEIGTNSDKILKTLVMAYKKAPYFENIYPLIENILTQDEKNLAKFIGYSLEKISEYLQINTKFIYSSDIKKDNDLKSQEKIIEILRKLNATHYINAIGGQTLYDKIRFEQENIKINFIETEIIQYKQFNNEFISNLSILDILMFNSIEDVKNTINKFKLI